MLEVMWYIHTINQHYVPDLVQVTSKVKEGIAKSFCLTLPGFANMKDMTKTWKPSSGWIFNSSRSIMQAH